jgi:DNA-directed RNA polymerase subunit RPC12/RpoP
MLLNSYSERTKCPECRARVRLEDVKLTPTFPCPHCGAIVGASDTYQRTMICTVAILALLIPYLLEVRSWFGSSALVPIYVRLIFPLGICWEVLVAAETCTVSSRSSLDSGSWARKTIREGGPRNHRNVVEGEGKGSLERFSKYSESR